MELWNYVLLIGACLLLIIIMSFLLIMLVKNKWIKSIYETVATSIKEAEEKYKEPGSGKIKMDYVLSAVEVKCNELKIPYTIIKLIVVNLINTIVSNYNIIAK